MELSNAFGLLSLVGCCISVLNFVRYDELRRKYELTGENLSRNRRDVGPDDSRKERINPQSFTTNTSKTKPSLFTNINELKGFIKEELQNTIDSVLYSALEKKLNNWLKEMKCNCVGGGQRGPKGEKGERGPQGERGERGPSLHPPNLQQRNLSIIANVSGSKTFTCQFLGNPIPSVKWKSFARNQQVTKDVDRYNSLVTSELTISNIIWEDRGNVTCYASNLLGEAEGSGSLTVHAAPIISMPLAPVVSTIGSVADFPECKVISEPPASISWTRGFLAFPKTRTWKKDGVLRIEKVHVSDEGHYVCTAKNYLGISRQYLQLRVQPLQFSNRSRSRIYRSNSAVSLNCAASGSVKRLTGKWIRTDSNDMLDYRTTKKDSELVFTTDAQTSGTYKCEITDGVSTIDTLTEVALFKMNSTLMSSEELDTLGGWLRNDNVAEYKLCWRMSEHGNNTEAFYNNCTEKANTITIFKSESGSILGAFTDVPWTKYDKQENAGTGSWSTGCGGKVSGRGIHYPSYGRYKNQIDCTWVIARRAPFTLKFLQFNVEHCPSCSCDAVEVEGQRLCGSTIPNDIKSNGNFIILRFRSDPRTSSYGFKVEILEENVEYKYSRDTFMFDNLNGMIQQVPIQNMKKAVCSGDKYGPCFGEKSMVYSQPGILTVNDGSSQSSSAQLEDVEVFYRVNN